MKPNFRKKRKWYWIFNYQTCSECGYNIIWKEKTLNKSKKGWKNHGFTMHGGCEIRTFL